MGGLNFSHCKLGIDLIKVAISAWGRCIMDDPFQGSEVFPSVLDRSGIALVRLRGGDPNVYVALDYHRATLRAVSKVVPRESRLLVAFEPKAVNPAQHRAKIRDKFAKTYVMSPLQLVTPGDEAILMGAIHDLRSARQSLLSVKSRPENSIVMLNANKYSFVPGNQYKFRQVALEALARNHWDCHIGGMGWKSTVPSQLAQQSLMLLSTLRSGQLEIDLRNFRILPNPWSAGVTIHGQIEDGLEFMKMYNFALVIENDPNYVSEKLVNAIIAGCVPIYVGPALPLHGIPASVALSSVTSVRELLDVIRQATPDTQAQIRAAGSAWLSSPGVLEEWSQKLALHRLALAVRDFAVSRGR